MIKISIVVPIYNAALYLENCINSLISQTLKEIEIICINDGSTDSSLDILEKFKQEDERIIIINQLNTGLSGARNAGVRIAKGEFLTFVDSDDWIDLDMLQLLYTKAVKTKADVVMCSYVKEFGDHSTNVSIYNSEGVMDLDYVLRRLVGPIDEEVKRPQDLDLPVSACMQIIRRDKIEGIYFVDTKEIGTEDLWFQLQVYRNCEIFYYTDKPLYHYRRSDYGTLTTKYMPDKFERWQNLFSKIEHMIDENKLPCQFLQALTNREAISMLGVGLNEILSSEGFFAQSKRMKRILSSTSYKECFKHFQIRYIKFPWNVFYWLCKMRCSSTLIVLLKIIEFLRKNI